MSFIIMFSILGFYWSYLSYTWHEIKERTMKEMIPRSNGDNYCQKLKPRDNPLDIHDSLVKGLVFRVAPNGSKSWILRYHYKEGDE